MENTENLSKGINRLDDQDLIKKSARYNGVECPTCKRRIKTYKRQITPTMCIALLEIYKWYKHAEDVELEDYFEKDDVFSRLEPSDYNDYTLLYYWDLIEPQGSHPKKFIKKRGSWRITQNGLKFAQLEIAMPKYAFVYNGEVSDHSTPPVMMDEILKGAGLDYYELLNDIG